MAPLTEESENAADVCMDSMAKELERVVQWSNPEQDVTVWVLYIT